MSNEIGEMEQLLAPLNASRLFGDDLIDPNTGEVIPNVVYTNLRNRLRKLSPDSKYLTADVPVVKHDPPMTALVEIDGVGDERVKELSRLIDGFRKSDEEDNEEETFLSQHYHKRGIPVALYYEQGKLVRAVLRAPEGEEGEDVTENILHVEGVPSELKDQENLLKVDCVIWGDIECLRSNFRRILSDWQNIQYGLEAEPLSARLYAAESIRSKAVKERKLSFSAHTVAAGDLGPKGDIERAKYFRENLRIPHVEVRPFRWRDLPVLEEFSTRLDCDVDGLVISCEGFRRIWRFGDPAVVTEIDEIDWRPDENSGLLVPYFLLKPPVRVNGKTVKEISGKSLGFLEGTSEDSLGKLNRWAEVKVATRGVPRVVGIHRSAYTELRRPKECPSCKTELVVRENNLYCTNEFCGVRSLSRITHFLDTMEVKLPKGVIQRLLESGLVRYPDQIYNLTVDNLGTVGYNPRQALNIIAKVYQHPDPHKATDKDLKAFLDKMYKENIKVPGYKLLVSLGIPGVGETVSKSILAHFGSFQKIRDATKNQWAKSGLEVAETVQKFFEEYDGMVEYLLKVIEPV